MNTSDQIIAVLDNLCQKFGVAVNWSGENIFPYIQELINKFVMYELWTSIAVSTLVLILFLIVMFLCARAWKHTKKCLDDDYVDGRFVIIMIIIFAVCILFGTIIIQAKDIITCLTIPEKIIFDYLQELPKQ